MLRAGAVVRELTRALLIGELLARALSQIEVPPTVPWTLAAWVLQ